MISSPSTSCFMADQNQTSSRLVGAFGLLGFAMIAIGLLLDEGPGLP